MSEVRDGVRKIAAFFLYAAGAVFVLAFVACCLIQGTPLALVIPDVIVFIAYFCGPLPIGPAALGLIAVLIYGSSWLMK